MNPIGELRWLPEDIRKWKPSPSHWVMPFLSNAFGPKENYEFCSLIASCCLCPRPTHHHDLLLTALACICSHRLLNPLGPYTHTFSDYMQDLKQLNPCLVQALSLTQRLCLFPRLLRLLKGTQPNAWSLVLFSYTWCGSRLKGLALKEPDSKHCRLCRP